ncbi:hypothetical protein LOD99_1580 [Oopsacas minuta]|uniref:AIG1-type G domain-containing protein n=1 Tax=Oopsacas minuta TaxID=111878 RepID=A0AAV7K4L6_9METZ|nr:hypothetical protein LOD99_1580 [Oopsacas minuta]
MAERKPAWRNWDNRKTWLKRARDVTLIPPKRDFDRTFILIGKVNSGKSTLANLLYGIKDKITFRVHPHKQAYCTTTEMSCKEFEVESSIVYGRVFQGNEKLKVQIMDQPGSNDSNYTDQDRCDNIVECLKVSRAELSNTFLIVFDMSGKFFTIEDTISILNLSEILSNSGYKFFENAILVVTHADQFDNYQEKFRQMLEMKEYASISHLLKQINKQHIFINGLDITEENRNNLLKTLFQMSKPKLNVSITGNHGFLGSELRELLQLPEDDLVENDSTKFDVEYFFNPDMNIFDQFDKLTLEQRVQDELKKLFIVSRGITAMVVLISLEEAFSEEFYNLINSIPETYSIGSSSKVEDSDIWKYTFIVFLSPVSESKSVLENIQRNTRIKKLVARVNNRYTWVTRGMSPADCHNKLIEMVLQVGHDAQGRTLINNQVVKQMNKFISGPKSPQNLERVKPRTVTDLNKMQQSIPCFEIPNSDDFLIRANTFDWNKPTISCILGYFILKRLKPEAAERFQEDFPESEISREQFREFCLANLN